MSQNFQQYYEHTHFHVQFHNSLTCMNVSGQQKVVGPYDEWENV